MGNQVGLHNRAGFVSNYVRISPTSASPGHQDPDSGAASLGTDLKCGGLLIPGGSTWFSLGVVPCPHFLLM